jgi:hypothetical protein
MLAIAGIYIYSPQKPYPSPLLTCQPTKQGPTSIAIIAFALLMAFNETLRETLRETAAIIHKVALGIIRDFVVRPVRDTWAAIVHGIPPAVSDSSPLKDRVDRYLGYRRHRRRYLEGDIWTRREDRTALPFPTTVRQEYELGGRGKSEMPGLM